MTDMYVSSVPVADRMKHELTVAKGLWPGSTIDTCARVEELEDLLDDAYDIIEVLDR